jgi:hypothetical protein
MNRIIKRHVPVGDLPKDWQSELPEYSYVDVEIRVEEGRPRDIEIASLVGSARNIHGNETDILSHIESLRVDR